MPSGGTVTIWLFSLTGRRICGIEQGFSNYGSRPHLGSHDLVFGSRNRLAVFIRIKSFCNPSKQIEK